MTVNTMGSGGSENGSGCIRMEDEFIRRHHRHDVKENQCSSSLVKHIKAPVHLVWSLVRRFDEPQKYKPFISRCIVQGDLEIGSVREVNVKSGLPATTSTERLEFLDDEEHILSMRIVGGDHRLKGRKQHILRVTYVTPGLAQIFFNGDQDVDVTTWLFLLDRFFSLHDTPQDQRLNIAALYMTGPALQWMHKHNACRLSSWDLFVRDLEIRFEPSPYYNPEVSLYKLRQLGSVADYLSEFEALSARVKGLTLQNLFNCFISGLRDDISQELVFLRPKSLTDAIRMAKLVEQKLNDSKALI